MAHRPTHTLRVAVYSHDTYGLGHLTRSTRLARAVLEEIPQASVLLLTGSPVAHRFRFPRGLDYVKLPSVVKTGPERYEARDLGLSNRRIRGMREQLLLNAVRHFRPHLVLVDNVPTGMKGELLATLDYLRTERPRTRIHLDLRDVLDTPDVIRRVWHEKQVGHLLERYYDEISVFGVPEIYDAQTAYDLPPEKTRFMGYIAPYTDERNGHPELPPCTPGCRRILVTSGGGGDGAELLLCAALLQQRLGESSPYQFHLVTGPLMDNEHQERLRESLPGLRNVTVHEFVQPLAAWMRRVDLVLSMGGYNTLCEVMSLAKRSIVVPRVRPRREQMIRARALESAGVVRVLPPDRLTPEDLQRALARAFESAPRNTGSGKPPWMVGIDAFKQRIGQLYGNGLRSERRERRVTRRQSAPSTGTSDGHRQDQGVQGGEVISTPKGQWTSVGQPGPLPMASRVDPTGAGRRYPPGPTLTSLWVWLWLLITPALLAPPAGALELVPGEMEGRFLFGHDSNLLDASDAERYTYDSSSPEAFFVVDGMEDQFFELVWEGTWELGRTAGAKHEFGFGYERKQFLHNPIKSEEAFAGTYYLRPGGDLRFALEAQYRPQVYGRHRFDKDALPGAAQFRSEVHERWDFELEMRRQHSDRVQLTFEVDASQRRYTEAFAERDRVRLGGSGEFELEVGSTWKVGAELGYRHNRSSNEPDLGKDLSNREYLVTPFFEFEWPLLASTLGFSLELTWREYTSQNPQDWNHYGRHDRFGDLSLSWERALTRWTSLYSEYRTQWREARLDSGQDVDYDEEGTFSEHIISGGVRWSWESD